MSENSATALPREPPETNTAGSSIDLRRSPYATPECTTGLGLTLMTVATSGDTATASRSIRQSPKSSHGETRVVTAWLVDPRVVRARSDSSA